MIFVLEYNSRFGYMFIIFELIMLGILFLLLVTIWLGRYHVIIRIINMLITSYIVIMVILSSFYMKERRSDINDSGRNIYSKVSKLSIQGQLGAAVFLKIISLVAIVVKPKSRRNANNTDEDVTNKP